MKLYNKPLSPYCAFIRIIAEVKDLPLKLIDAPAGPPLPESFREISPMRRIPVLVTGSGETLFEASVIAEYLEERFPEKPMLPADPKDRAQIRIIMRLLDLDVLPSIIPVLLAGPANPLPADKAAKVFNHVHHALKTVEDRISSGPYALGEHVTLADAWLAPTRFLLESLRRFPGFETILDDCPNIEGYKTNAEGIPEIAAVLGEMQDARKALAKAS
ncbi:MULTISPECIES: glutathione S-transferase family protein [Pseudochrobactrum]|uniref:Glutathione S-transferase n=1 Tax=Pseudochrobactrum saccharolyticum TaxID=354352 RepID=A0A7W8AJ67_9HYPH|nr:MULTISPECIES: glutathione S-transferase family protein [Pseudochrobactrum]KAB0538798.1 glutathione S-transferase family protein [Pseudochrobactrum saccharolyticum]MBB5091235.1 glutathione S-transferase [Pseudochrobactrum saccharolyticum]MDP8249963.1 glutathione S-transferase family protein [Pseudochrobactrum saccharolyticum]QYM73579.1 glutathione S-transferase family protein [Pseudochrobactrum sp. Wa41.01b-1]